jgi:serine/threonine protein kinase
MSTDTCAIAAAVLLALILGIALIVSVRSRREACATCGKRVRRSTPYCPACGAERVSARPDGVSAESAAHPADASSAELVAIQGPLAQHRFSIPSQGLTIGRHPDNDVVLADELMVSRHHAVITVEDGQYVLYDRDSANGIWVNEQRIFRHVLEPGDRIQVWQSKFAFGAAGAPLPPTPASAPLVPTLHITGETFAGYQLGPLIGRGGMSEVFKAWDSNGQSVAIKILQQSDPYLVAKFVQEGNEIGPLLRDHPSIVYVHEFGQSADNRLYIVMEYVEAPSLRKTIRRSWTEPEVVEVMGQVCQALAFAHENNIVHRDIKPENILVTPEGSVKVLDFGIAKLTSAATVTRDKIVGTPEYISPEQARGEPVQPASDVYSLGIVLYEILSGSVPFRRLPDEDPYKSAMEVIRQHLRERPEPLKKRNPKALAPARLERVAMRALKKEVKSRYPTAEEMGKALGFKESVRAQPAPPKPKTASLLILQGLKQGQRIPLPDQELSLGRLDLDSADLSISRQHVGITSQGGKYWLQDMSRNGTWVDNERVYGQVPLQTGAIIVIGDTILRLERDS